MSILKIDGSLGEGGGQVLRISLCLSALFKIPIEIENIRVGRTKPGLAAQHLKGVELIKEMCNAKVIGANVGSTRLEFHPGPLQGQKRQYLADTKTAGCIALLAQIALPCALFTPSTDPVTLILKGGTNVPMGPQVEYVTEVFKPILNKFKADFDFSLIRRGYYPPGGGEFHMIIKPVRHLNAVELIDPGIPAQITGWSFVAGVVPINEAHRMANDAQTTITQGLSKYNIAVPPIDILAYKEERGMAVGNASGINVVCTTSSGCIFGGSGLKCKRDETKPGVEAANEILTSILSSSCVDEHLQDQLIILMALARGTSKISIGRKEPTSHTRTAIEITKIFLGSRGLRLNASKGAEDHTPYIIECEGCGLINDSLRYDD